LVIDKAAGMVVHPGAGHSHGTVVNAVLHKLKVKPEIGGELRPGIVHRLDKDTSGLMVIARTDAALRGLHEAFKSREVDKRYLAIAHGVLHPFEGTWSTLYGRHPRHRQKFSGRVKRGKPAVTHYRVLEPFESASLIEVVLETGRTHQIRVHFAEAGHPLLCDLLYGKKHDDALITRQALHAQKLSFAHPVTGKALSFEVKPPKDFQAALKRLRSTAPSAAGASRAP
jgi:23S rRNA pseudouridine1911/1915/1917 synthase